MSITSRLDQGATFAMALWKNRNSVRRLLNSNNYRFVRDYPPGHFYSPLPDLDEIRRIASVVFDRSVDRIPGVALNEWVQCDNLRKFSTLYDECMFHDVRSEGNRYYFDNPFYGFGDGLVLYCVLRQFSPKQVVEVGSGFSSAAMLDVNDQAFDSRIAFTFIEPFPDRLYGLLSDVDKSTSRIEPKPVQSVPGDVFTALEANDILFIDSSHVAKIGSDLVHVLFNVLPSLRPGVLVHFHDVMWPFEYPEVWLEEGRAWNEVYLLRAFLQYNSSFEIVYFNSYIAHCHRDLLGQLMPKALAESSFPETLGNSSLWLRKV